MVQLINPNGNIAGAENQKFQLHLLQSTDSSCTAVETFIHDVFAHAYGADVQQFLPRLLSLRQNGGAVIAALGIREAASDALFVENYLDEPVERLLSRTQGITVQRDRIVEVGNLASIQRGGLRQLIIALTAYLSGAGTEWVVFTAVPVVHKAFAALGLTLYPLAIAERTRLGCAAESWGNYYDHAPVVFAGRVADGFSRLRDVIYQDAALSLGLHLWEQAFVTGYRQRLIESSTLPQLAAVGGL